MEQRATHRDGTYAVGVDVGGTNVRAGVITRDGKKLAEARRPARAMEGYERTQQMIIEAAEEAIASAGVPREALMGLGLGVPGRHKSAEGIVIFSPNFAGGWANVPLLGRIVDHFGVGAFMGNDVAVASLGEFQFGAGKGYADMAMITLGTGIGGSLIAGGRLMLGATEGFAEVGHHTVDPDGPVCNCGNHGCWEQLAGRDAIIERAVFKLQAGRDSTLNGMTGGDIGKITPALIAEAAGRGDALATEVMDETGMWVGIGIANLIQLYDPQIVIVGGGISQAGELLFAPIRRTAVWRGRMVPAADVQIVPAALGDDAGIFGGAVMVFTAADGDR